MIGEPEPDPELDADILVEEEEDSASPPPSTSVDPVAELLDAASELSAGGVKREEVPDEENGLEMFGRGMEGREKRVGKGIVVFPVDELLKENGI